MLLLEEVYSLCHEEKDERQVMIMSLIMGLSKRVGLGWRDHALEVSGAPTRRVRICGDENKTD